MLRLLL
jgi:hypothetical protein